MATSLSEMRDDIGVNDEVMSLGIFALLAPEVACGQEKPVAWAASDRAMTTPLTIQPLVLDAGSPWTAVKALCAGVGRAESKDDYATRWRYVWAEPVFRPERRLPLGAAVLSTVSQMPATELPVPRSGFGLNTERAKRLRDGLLQVGRTVLLR